MTLYQPAARISHYLRCENNEYFLVFTEADKKAAKKKQKQPGAQQSMMSFFAKKK
jgi:hypothetical protein